MEQIKLQSDELEVGIRKSDNSRWCKFYVGEQEKEALSQLFNEVGNTNLYDVTILIERH